MLYSVVASFPLFFAGAAAVRIQADLDLSTAQFGLAASAYFATSAIGSTAIGGWVDRRGARSGFVAAGAGAAIASLVIAVEPSPVALAVGLGTAGLANAAGQLAANRVLASVDAARQGAGFGIKQAAVPLGSLAAGLIVGAVGDVVAWRAAFTFHAGLALVIAAISPAARRPPSRAATGGGGSPMGGIDAVDRGLLAALALAGALGGATGNGLAVLVVDAFAAAGYDEAIGGAALALGSAIAIVVRVGIGWLAGRRGGTGFAELGAAFTVGAVGFGLLAAAGGDPALLWIGATLGFAGAWGWPGVMYFAVVRTTVTGPGAATGLVVAGVFFGGIVGTPAMAAMADRWSYGLSWAVAAAATLLGAALVVVAGRLAPTAGQAEPATPASHATG